MTDQEMDQVLRPDAPLHTDVSEMLANLATPALRGVIAVFNGALELVGDEQVQASIDSAFDCALLEAMEVGFKLGVTGRQRPEMLLFQEKAPTCVDGTDEGFREDPYISDLESVLG